MRAFCTRLFQFCIYLMQKESILVNRNVSHQLMQQYFYDREKGKIVLMKNTIHCYHIRFLPHQFHCTSCTLYKMQSPNIGVCHLQFHYCSLGRANQPFDEWIFPIATNSVFEFHSVTALFAFVYVFICGFGCFVDHFQASFIRISIKCQCEK